MPFVKSKVEKPNQKVFQCQTTDDYPLETERLIHEKSQSHIGGVPHTDHQESHGTFKHNFGGAVIPLSSINRNNNKNVLGSE